jgi:hypothetical protein
MIELIAISVCVFTALSIQVGQKIYESKRHLKNGSAHPISSPKSESAEKFYISYRSRPAWENELSLNRKDRSPRVSSISGSAYDRLVDPLQNCCSREETYLLSPLDTNVCHQDLRSYADYLEHRYGVNFNGADVKEPEARIIRLPQVRKLPAADFVRPVLQIHDAQHAYHDGVNDKKSELALHSVK